MNITISPALHSRQGAVEMDRCNLDSREGARQHWAVLLAGGDGTRLQSLTHKIAGDCRPKQFCALFGGKSLLAQTQERVAPLFDKTRTLSVFTRAHERYYRVQGSDFNDRGTLVQPLNRGTAVAIAAALLRISRSDPGALVTLFPCDHFYADNDAFTRVVRAAAAFARKNSKSVVLVGAKAHYPEVEYGWIESGVTISDEASTPLLSVKRFWEKPDVSTAESLLERGCLWNTFVSVGYASTMLEMMSSQVPDVTSLIAAGIAANDLESVYREIRSVDFSHEVLAPLPHRLLTVCDAESGWADLGTPARVVDTLSRNGIKAHWLRNFNLSRSVAS
jgi:mannose-1-phosphate guanylyltransferase